MTFGFLGEGGLEEFRGLFVPPRLVVVRHGLLYDEGIEGVFFLAFCVLRIGGFAVAAFEAEHAVDDAEPGPGGFEPWVVFLFVRAFFQALLGHPERLLCTLLILHGEVGHDPGHEDFFVVRVEFEDSRDFFQDLLVSAGSLIRIDAHFESGDVVRFDGEHGIRSLDGFVLEPALQCGLGEHQPSVYGKARVFHGYAQGPDGRSGMARSHEGEAE